MGMITKVNASFDLWKSRVNAIIENIAGLSADDLPDCNYRDWYDDDMSAREAAREALEEAGFSDE